jgi:hypothetical protein
LIAAVATRLARTRRHVVVIVTPVCPSNEARRSDSRPECGAAKLIGLPWLPNPSIDRHLIVGTHLQHRWRRGFERAARRLAIACPRPKRVARRGRAAIHHPRRGRASHGDNHDGGHAAGRRPGERGTRPGADLQGDRLVVGARFDRRFDRRGARLRAAQTEGKERRRLMRHVGAVAGGVVAGLPAKCAG